MDVFGEAHMFLEGQRIAAWPGSWLPPWALFLTALLSMQALDEGSHDDRCRRQFTADNEVCLCQAELLRAISTPCRANTCSLQRVVVRTQEEQGMHKRHALSLYIPEKCLRAVLAGQLCNLSLHLPPDLSLRWYNHHTHCYRLLYGTCLHLFT